jgi:hypothetical protein
LIIVIWLVLDEIVTTITHNSSDCCFGIIHSISYRSGMSVPSIPHWEAAGGGKEGGEGGGEEGESVLLEQWAMGNAPPNVIWFIQRTLMACLSYNNNVDD